MAYSPNNLKELLRSASCTLWKYTSNESFADTEEAGFFNDASDAMRIGDIIIFTNIGDAIDIASVYLVTSAFCGTVIIVPAIKYVDVGNNSITGKNRLLLNYLQPWKNPDPEILRQLSKSFASIR